MIKIELTDKRYTNYANKLSIHVSGHLCINSLPSISQTVNNLQLVSLTAL